MLIGSHLDTQPRGGKFDGVLGVLAGLEVMRTLNDLGITTRRRSRVVNWTNEEGGRFGPSMMGSGVWAGVLPVGGGLRETDAEGVTVGTALDGIGYRRTGASRRPVDAYFELHIEQGPMLESEGKPIGIVTGGARRWSGRRGRDRAGRACRQHTDGEAEQRAGRRRADRRRWSTASACAAARRGARHRRRMEVAPNSRNVIPGEVQFTIEFRHPDAARLERDGRRVIARPD